MDKAPDAFRTISEVAEGLETPAHVLRFWESRFPQIKPVKRAGGRRYYRPADVALLSGIRQLLHTEGMTIRGVQKILREQGVRHVAALGGADVDAFDLEAEDALADSGVPAPAVPVKGQIVPMDSLTRRPAGVPLITPAEVQALFRTTKPIAEQGRSGPAEPSATPVPFGEPTPSGSAALSGTSGSLANAEPPENLDSAGPIEPREGHGTTAPQAEDVADTMPLAGPREGEGGFLSFLQIRRPSPRLPGGDATPPAQASLPFDAEVPEAPHVWVEDDDDPAPTAALHNLPKAPLEALVAGILAEEFGAALSEEVAQALEAATAVTAEDDDRAAETAAADLTDQLTAGDFSHDGLTAPGLTTADFAETAEPAAQAESGSKAESGPDAMLVPDLSGLATRLRNISPAVSRANRDALAELHSRLGLLHAQMAEAIRLRRQALGNLA